MAYKDMPDVFQILPEVVFEDFLLGCRNAGLLHIWLHFWYLLSLFSTPWEMQCLFSTLLNGKEEGINNARCNAISKLPRIINIYPVLIEIDDSRITQFW